MAYGIGFKSFLVGNSSTTKCQLKEGTQNFSTVCLTEQIITTTLVSSKRGRTRNHEFDLKLKKHFNGALSQNYFSWKIYREWNSLPVNTVNNHIFEKF